MSAKELVNNLSIIEKIEIYNCLYEDLAGKGIGGDTELAHVNKTEMAVLRAMGGSGTINPNTNLIQFMDDDPPPAPPSVTTTTQTSEFPSELRPFVQDIFEKSQAIQEQRQEEGFRPELTQRLAAFTPEQEASFRGIEEVVGQSRPLFDEATALSRGAARAATDPEEVAALMNPFLRNVTDIEKREAQRAADIQRQQLDARAAQAGAFGGSRAAILEAERQRNLNQQLGDIESRGRLAAFQDPQNRLQQQFGREAGTAAQLGALGSAIPAQAFKELGALSGIGAAKQQQAQRALDIATQQAREEYGHPMATLQDFSAILRGFPLPATKDVTQKTFSPAQPLATQLLGVGTGLAGLAGAAGAFKKAGGRVGGPSPVRLKHGGYIKLAAGGGLSQLMRGKLPSNRVRMGKTAYQDVTNFNINELINPKGPNPLSVLTEEELVVSLRDPQKLSDLSVAGITILDIRKELADRQLTSTRLQQDTTKRDSRTPAAIALDATQRAAAARNIGTGDTPTLEAERFMSFNPKTGALTPRVEPILQSQLRSLSPEQQLKPEETIEEMFTAGESPFIKAPIPKAKVTSFSPVVRRQLDADMGQAFTAGVSPGVSPPNLMSAASPNLMSADSLVSAPYTPDPLNMEALARRIRSGDHSGSEPRRKTAPGERLRPIKNTSLATVDPSEGEVIKAQVDERASLIEEGLNPDIRRGGQLQTRPTEEIVGDGVEPTAAKTPAAKKDEPDGGPAMDGAEDKGRPSPGNNREQIDYNAKIAEFKNKDYSKEVELALGPAPVYEKGEKPDFASQKYLTLLGISARILASNKPALQALGDAVQPAIKELADMGKEERKIERELRKERNAQKRMDYQDKAARLKMRRELRGDDVDMFTSLARLKAQEDSNEISRQNANTNAARAISENAYRKFKMTEEQLNARLENKGQLKLSYVDKLLASTRASASKNSGALAKNDFGVVDPKKVRGYYEAAYRAQLPSILESIDGRVVNEKGVVVPRERLMKLLGLDATSKPAGNRQATRQGLNVPKDPNLIGTKG